VVPQKLFDGARSMTTYGYNEAFLRGETDAAGNPIKGANVNQVQMPTKVLVIGDSRSPLGGWSTQGFLMRYAVVNSALDNIAKIGGCCGGRPVSGIAAGHPPTSNIGFLDGHVKNVQWSDLMNGTAINRIRYHMSEVYAP
jgi:prepilin-type processing-associated H-X9-DG protein